MKKIILVILTCLFGQLFNYSIFAEEGIEIGEIVVTATKTEKEKKEIPASISVIKKDEIEISSSQNNIRDFIQWTPSVDVRSYSGMANAGTQVVSIRGINLRGTLLLVDNQPLNDGLNGFANFHLIPKDDIERIEIIRGPFSVLYGSNAVGGVINILTKDKFKEEIKAGIEFGNFDYQNYRFLKSGTLKNIVYNLIFERRYIDNYLADKNQVNRDYDENRFRVKISKNIHKNSSLTFTSGYFISKAGYGKTENLSQNKESEIKNKDYYGNLIYERKLNKLNYKINLSTHLPDVKFISESIDPNKIPPFPPKYIPSTMNYSSYDTIFSANGNLKLNKNNITFGIENSWMRGKWSIVNSDTGQPISSKLDKEVRNFAIYAQDEIALDRRILLISGIRVDRHSKWGGELSPKLSLNYKLDENKNIYLSFGKAFRTPTIGELYSPAWMRRPGALYIGNPNLKPERCSSWEVGIKNKVKEGLNINISFYQNRAKDLITLVSSGNFEKAENIEKAKIQGLEFEILYILNKNLNTFLNYSYLDTKDKNGKTLDYSPYNKANLGIKGKLQNINFNLTTNFVDKRFYTDRKTLQKKELKSYSISELNINYRLNEKLSIFVTGKNIFNKTCQEFAGYPAARRTVSFGINKNF